MTKFSLNLLFENVDRQNEFKHSEKPQKSISHARNQKGDCEGACLQTNRNFTTIRVNK